MATKPKTPEPSVLDEIVWRHRNIVIPVLWTAMVGVVGGFTTDAVGVASWLVALVAVATGLLAAGAAVVLEEPPRVTWFWFLLLVAAGAYLTWCAAAGWPQRAQLLALIPAGIVFGLWWNVLHLLNTAEQQIIRDDQAKAEQEAASGQWERLLARIGCKGVTVKDRVGFPAGHTLHLKLPANGSVTFRKLTAAVEQLEIAADARPGSLVFEKPKNVGAATVLLHVFERDVLTETLPLEVDRGPKSIHDPIPLGLYQTGEVCVVTFREVSGLMVGMRGRGKSGLLNTHLAHLTGCVDAVVWMIDGKGGRTVRPWLESFLAATTGRPAVDWACMDAESPEAEAILLGVKAAIRSRSRGGGEKIHPGPAMPSIILIVEEASLITGTGRMSNSKRAALAQDAVNTGRSEAVESLLATQRGTVSMVGNGDMKSNQNLRYGLGVSSADDARMIFPDGDLARAATALSDDDDYRGVFLMQAPGATRVMPAKGYWLAPDTIAGVAASNARHRADLDDETAEAVHQALLAHGVPGGYHGRWDRFRAEVGMPVETVPASQAAPAGTSHGASQAPSQPGAGTARMSTAERLGLPPSHLFQGPYDKRPRAGAETPPETTPETTVGTGSGTSGETAGGDEFERLTSEVWDAAKGRWRDDPADVGEYPEEERDADVIPPILRHLVRIFEARSADQLPTQVILDDLPGEMTAKRLGLLMGHCGVSPRENVGEKRVRGYARLDVARAFTRARDHGAPPAAFDWEP